MGSLSEGIVQETTIYYLINVVRNFKVSVDEALAKLNIPKDERPFYKEQIDVAFNDTNADMDTLKARIVQETILTVTLRYAKKMTANLGVSFGNALEALEIVPEERPVYQELFENNELVF